MRILLATPNDNDVGGVASVLRTLATSLGNHGHQVLFLHPVNTTLIRPKATKLGFPGFGFRMQMPFGERHRMLSFLAFLVFFPIGMYQVVRFIRRNQIDIINIHYPAGCLFYLALCRRLLGVKLITSVHGADIFPDGTLRKQISRALGFLLYSSDLIVTPSRSFQRTFSRAFPDLAGKTTFIHNGVDLAELDDHFARTADAIPGPYVFCISAYKEQKAIDVLIRAFKKVHEVDPAVKLVIVGPGPLRSDFAKLAVSLGIQSQIELHGPKNRAEVTALLRGCKVFVLPSRFETFGIVILEAMAFSKPVVATTAGGIPEIIEHGKNGMLVQPDDPDALAESLIRLLKDGALQQRLGESGYATAHERFGSDQTAAKYESAFAKVFRMTSRGFAPSRASQSLNS
jgi:glycosyltransferase involved in cell wall biosynthesis